MKFGALAFWGIAVSGAALADPSVVKFDVILTRDGKVVSSPTIVSEFGKPARIELERVMKVEAVASAPDKDGNSFTSVKLHLFENGEMWALKEMSMLADLAKTPSIEYSVPGTGARFVFRPRFVRLPEVEG